MASKDKENGEASTEEYAAITDDVIRYGGACLALCLAQETGILTTLLSSPSPISSTDLAQQAGLKERFVREVLNALTSARLVQVEGGRSADGSRVDSWSSQDLLYVVPDQHKASLERTAIYALPVGIMSRRYQAVRDCFPQDASACVRYDTAALTVMDTIGSYRADDVFKLLVNTPGLKEQLERGIHVGEIGCGFGRMSRKLAAMFPNSHFMLTDISPTALEGAQQETGDREGQTNISFRVVDACQMPADLFQRFDWMFALNVIHDLPHPGQGLAGVEKALKAGGIFSMLDTWTASDVRDNVGQGRATLLYSLSTFSCIPESFQLGDSEALGACWGEEQARAILHKAGLELLDVKQTDKMFYTGLYTCQKPS